MNDVVTPLQKQKLKPVLKNSELVTEDNAAQEFANLYQGKLKYDHDLGAWFEFDGSIWRQNKTGIALHWARELDRRLAKTEPDKVRYTVNKVAFAAGVERFARVDPIFSVTSDGWDIDPFLLGTPGGTVDLKTGHLRASDPAYAITKSTAIIPADKARCPIWDRFLNETTGGDDSMIRFLQQFFGYCLTGDTREHSLVFGHGPGGNGKSVVINTVRGIMADYASTAAMDTFTASKGDRHSTDLAMLRGARLVTASETEEGRAWAESRIKSLTGGDPITARFVHQNNFTFQPKFKLFIVGNHLPILRNVDDAARRRFNIVGFTNKPPHPDRELEQKLRPEWPSILRWMIDGCMDWQKNGLIRPASVQTSTADYFDSQDIVRQWLDEACDVEPGNRWKQATAAELFASFSAFAKAAGETPGSQKSFAEVLQNRGLESFRTNRSRGFKGVRLILKTQDGDG